MQKIKFKVRGGIKPFGLNWAESLEIESKYATI